jgi:hypothetical protein
VKLQSALRCWAWHDMKFGRLEKEQVPALFFLQTATPPYLHLTIQTRTEFRRDVHTTSNETMATFLPSAESGYLPYVVFFVGAIALGNSGESNQAGALGRCWVSDAHADDATTE